jgi:hypothetical protein
MPRPKTKAKAKPSATRGASRAMRPAALTAELMSYKQARAGLGCSRNTLFNWFKKGYIERGPGLTVTRVSYNRAVGRISA